MPRKSIDELLAPYDTPPRPGAGRAAFTRRSASSLRGRIDAQIEHLVARFELDRMLYDLELDAQRRWLANLAAFEAYAARRDRRRGKA